MHKILIAVAISTGIICAASAATATDWSGFQAGIFADRDSGSGDYFVSGVPQGSNLTVVGKNYGPFVGYNFQQGSLVYGGEIAYSSGYTGQIIAPAHEMTSFWDGKARVGYAFDSAMVYGVIGGAIGVYDNDGIEQLNTYSFIYGAGIDTMVTDKIFIGVEYLYREVVTDNSTLIPTDHWEYRVDSLQVRIGYKF